ncbi:primosomal protein N' [Ornithobacterium rhinotracheale]|uniref:replication restart helicase PriA n=1 Tax=Ornithobacterium rhinotracheale TaxID=28251 RepID=UPI00129D1C9B|nr:primosomal protein N' [Ornithobacterium rhinotracheale]MRJ08452.1 primosomal protein N' [Ornithobacterium rhinotracheale]UOH76728.1 primosomal protein N' [Ornithobacterium rhinotracheale]
MKNPLEIHFAEVILPLPIEGTFCYHIPREMRGKVQVGQRVAVPFGSRKLYTGIVHSIHQNQPELYKTKPIYALLDAKPLVTEKQIKFWEWVAEYYMCSLGDVYGNVFPTALKLDSDTFVKIVPSQKLTPEMELSDEAYTIWEALSVKGILSVDECADLVERKSALPLLKELMSYGLVILDEKLIQKYTPKIENYVRLNENISAETKAQSIQELSRAPKQRELYLKLIVKQKQSNSPVKVSEFIKENNTTHATLNALAEKHLVQIYEDQTQRVQTYDEELSKIKTLSPAQQIAFDSVQEALNQQKNVLLHGVTSSGKTEIYIKCIERSLAQRKKVLYLLPEISLTTQLTQRIQKYFGDQVGVYHSKFNQNERVELWEKVLNNEYNIIVGARSSLFLPLQDLGLVIVDEEHESSLKQTDTRPFYNARDAAMVWAKMNGAQVLLGSATPSLEMYYLAQENKIAYVSLTERYGNVKMPVMEIVDLREAVQQNRMIGHVSFELKNAILNAFEHKKQVIIFQNRRGFSPMLECNDCGHTPYCPNCDVSLTYHKLTQELKCHYCGHTQAKPVKCYECGSTDLKTVGLGTQQIEDEFVQLFPEHKIARMDVDSMRKKFAFEKLIEALENHEIDLLVGTQMVTKGLDFDDVNLVGIIKADSLLNFPDFRAHERAFQRIVQVAGRAGRRKEQGKVIVQAYRADHFVLKNAQKFDYENTANEILTEREHTLYPPYCKLIEITFRHKDHELAENTANYYTQMLKPFFNERTLLGPVAPSIARLNNQYRFKTLIKIKEGQSPKKIKQLLKEALVKLHGVSVFSRVRIDFDVDPS